MVPELSQEHDLDVDAAMQIWRQGDVCLDPGLDFVHQANLSHPGSTAAECAADQLSKLGEPLPKAPVPLVEEVPGFVVLTQTCDIIRPHKQRPFIEVAPLVVATPELLEDVRRLRRPAYAYVPATAQSNLVADLDRVMTIEKAVVASWKRTPGWVTDDQIRSFADALARIRARFAFPDDFAGITRALQVRMQKRHNRNHIEGAHLRALREIRVRAAPAWDADEVSLGIWFIKEMDPPDVEPNWPHWIADWTKLVEQSGRFQIEFAIGCRLEDLTAKDYVESDRLDLDSLSQSQ